VEKSGSQVQSRTLKVQSSANLIWVNQLPLDSLLFLRADARTGSGNDTNRLPEFTSGEFRPVRGLHQGDPMVEVKAGARGHASSSQGQPHAGQFVDCLLCVIAMCVVFAAVLILGDLQTRPKQLAQPLTGKRRAF
jgi:hypothetical protein